MKLLGKRLFDLFFLSSPKQPVVDKYTGQLVADGPMGQRGGHRRIHAPAQGANHTFLADLLTNLLHCRIHIRLHCPGRLAATNVVDEIPNDLGSFRRMNYFRMKLEAIDPALVIVALHGCDRRIDCMRDRAEARRHPLDMVSVRHPDDRRSAFANALKEIAVVVDREVGPAVLPMLGFGHLPAREMRHELHPVTNPEYGDPLVEEFLGNARRLLLIHAGGATRQHDALRTICENGRQWNGAGQNLRVDLGFANAACNQLGVLRPEIEDQDSIVPELHQNSLGERGEG